MTRAVVARAGTPAAAPGFRPHSCSVFLAETRRKQESLLHRSPCSDITPLRGRAGEKQTGRLEGLTLKLTRGGELKSSSRSLQCAFSIEFLPSEICFELKC